MPLKQTSPHILHDHDHDHDHDHERERLGS